VGDLILSVTPACDADNKEIARQPIGVSPNFNNDRGIPGRGDATDIRRRPEAIPASLQAAQDHRHRHHTGRR